MEFDTLTAYLDHWAENCGDKVWLRALHEQGSEDYTWSEARQQINAVGAALMAYAADHPDAADIQPQAVGDGCRSAATASRGQGIAGAALPDFDGDI